MRSQQHRRPQRNGKPTYQLITLGHPLSKKALMYLSSLGLYKKYTVDFHIQRFDDPYTPIYKLFKHLKNLGCDLSGRTPTLWQMTGSSLGSHLIHTAWHALTGEHMRVLNLIRQGDTQFNPSPELPEVSMQALFEEFPEVWAVISTQPQEVAEQEAVEDEFELGTPPEYNGRELRSEFRKLRELEIPPESQAAKPDEEVMRKALAAARETVRREAGLELLA